MKIGSVNSDARVAFQRDGYLILRGAASPARCDDLHQVAAQHLAMQIAPIEYEVDVKYPGSPADGSVGSDTPRRLLGAYARDERFRRWARDHRVREALVSLYGTGKAVLLSQCHHNCIMTKAPGYSSVTLWHQDNRYWSFDREDLLSVWLALGDERKANGCLRVIPGSHRLDIARGRFDAALFLRPDLAENKSLLSASVAVELQKGDALVFHSRLFHAAGRNLTDRTKFSLVFTYHEGDNHPIAGTGSASFPSVLL